MYHGNGSGDRKCQKPEEEEKGDTEEKGDKTLSDPKTTH